MATDWKVIKSGKDVSGCVIELRYAAFGKGRAKCHYWRIYRNNEQVDYGATETDAYVNYERVIAGGRGHADR